MGARGPGALGIFLWKLLLAADQRDQHQTDPEATKVPVTVNVNVPVTVNVNVNVPGTVNVPVIVIAPP